MKIFKVSLTTLSHTVAVVLESEHDVHTELLSPHGNLSMFMKEIDKSFNMCFPNTKEHGNLKRCIGTANLAPPLQCAQGKAAHFQLYEKSFMPTIIVLTYDISARTWIPVIMASVDVRDVKAVMAQEPDGLNIQKVVLWNICKNLSSKFVQSIPNTTNILMSAIYTYLTKLSDTSRIQGFNKLLFVLFVDKESAFYDVAYKVYQRIGFKESKMNTCEQHYFQKVLQFPDRLTKMTMLK